MLAYPDFDKEFHFRVDYSPETWIAVVVRQLDDEKNNIIPNETFLTSFKLKFFGFLKKEP